MKIREKAIHKVKTIKELLYQWLFEEEEEEWVSDLRRNIDGYQKFK